MVERNIIFQRSFELDDAAEELIEVLVQNNEPQYEELFARGFKKDDKKRERMKECLNRLGNINTNGTSPLEDDEIDLFKKMIFCSSSERISLIIGNSGLLKRLASACIRILLWAKDNNISDDKLIPIRMFISENYRTRILPMEYKDSIDDGTLNIPLFNVVIEKTQLTETGGTIPDKLK